MGKTTIFQWPWPEETGVTPDVPRDLKALLEAQESRLKTLEKIIGTPSAAITPEPGQLIVVDGTSHPAYKAATGDVAVNSSGVVTIADKAVTTRKTKLTGISAYQSADVTLGTGTMATREALTGTSKNIELAVESLVLVNAFFDFQLEEISGDQEQCQGTLVIGTTPQTPLAIAKLNHVESEAKRLEVTVGQTYLVAVPAGTTALSLRARIETVGGGNAGAYKCLKGNTGFTAVAVAAV